MHVPHSRPARALRATVAATFLLVTLLAFLVTLSATARAEQAGGAASAGTAAETKPLTVFAAASLKNVLDEAAAKFLDRTGRRVTAAYAASSALARQIEHGAPADLFISADLDWMDHLAGKGLVAADTRVNLAGNRLVLIAPSNSSAKLALAPGVGLDAALGEGRLAVADVAAVPAGRYAKAALESLGAWNDVKDRLAQAENVRAALALVARQEAPLGIVYASDVNAEPKVRIVATFPETSHPPIVYPAAVTASSTEAAGAKALLDFLHSSDGAALFTAHGFTQLTASP